MPRVEINKKFEPFQRIHKPLKILFGGRDSGKSIFVGDETLRKMTTEGADVYCLREFQDSINESVHKVLKKRIKDNELQGWQIYENRVVSSSGAVTTYKGASRNPDAVKSAQDYKYSWFEEAQTISQESLDELLPTIIRNPGAECWFTANPNRSTDPFSKRFLIPYLHELSRTGYYEDDLHLIIKVNWRDNPWYWLTPETELLRKWDFENLPRAKYDWIWEGAFNDGIEDALIMPEWFDACIDAHIKLGWEPKGIRIASFDPSDTGDAKAYCLRHGSVILDAQERSTGDGNEATDWACKLAIDHKIDAFTWDCDGMGVLLNRQISDYFRGKHINLAQYRGSNAVDRPNAVYNPAVQDSNVQNQKKNEDAFKNIRAQYHGELRDRVYRTYEAVEKGVYHNPDDMLSISSKIECLSNLRSEMCSMPIKPNRAGLIELYTKKEMKDKFKLQSPNLEDAIVMSLRAPMNSIIRNDTLPQPIRPMGKVINQYVRA